jgi:hypothetical protein
MNKKSPYFFLFLSKDSFEKDLPLEEILRERTFEYFSNQKGIDFWIFSGFSILPFFPFQNSFFYCLFTTNSQFFHFLKLRIGFFQELTYNSEKQAFSMDEKKNIKVDGFSFSCESNSFLFRKILESQKKNNFLKKF